MKANTRTTLRVHLQGSKITECSTLFVTKEERINFQYWHNIRRHKLFLFSLFVYGQYKTSHMKKPRKITENFLFSVSIYGVKQKKSHEKSFGWAEENGFCDKLTTR